MKSSHIVGFIRAALCLSLAALLVAMVLNLDVLFHEVELSGPFASESSGTKALVLDLRNSLPVKKVFSTGGDSSISPQKSTLRVWIDSVELSQPHALHDIVRELGKGAFSHWEDYLIFSLPPGVNNSEKTLIKIRYAAHVRPELISGAFLVSMLSGLLLVLRNRKMAPDSYERRVQSTLSLVGHGMAVIFAVVFAATVVFLATVVFGFFDGYALPNTAFFRLFPQANGLALIEPAFGHLVLVLALIGASFSWLASLNPSHMRAFREQEALLVSMFNRFGLLVMLGLFLFSLGATWAGIPRPQDLSGNAIAGLVPFSDANGHFQLVFSQVLHGTWDSFIARRPLAAAFRTVGMAFTDFNNNRFLMLQTTALAVVTFAAVRAVINWRGIWAAMTFLGLTYILQRAYFPANLTEPLGIFWSLAAIPFLVCALRTSCLSEGALGLHFTCWALLTRMGSMFTIPGLGLWTVLNRKRISKHWLIGVAVVVAVFSASYGFVGALSKLYGTEKGATGSNFSYSICGLTHNTDWVGCTKLYAEDIQRIPDEAGQAKFFYARAMEKFLSEPSLLFKRLAEGESHFLTNIHERMLTGYTGMIPDLFPKKIWMLFAMTGVFWVLVSHRARHELSFWVLILGSIILSAPFVIFDDGWRVLCTSFPLLALFIASGFTTPTTHSSLSIEGSLPRSRAAVTYILLVLCVVLCLIIPGGAHRIDWLGGRQLGAVSVNPAEEVILGANHMSGFLVLPDGMPLPKSPPAISFSAFARIIRNSGIEQYQSLVTPYPVFIPPFGIVSVPAYERKSTGLLIVPLEVMERKDIPAWRVRFEGGPYWYRVTNAAPVL